MASLLPELLLALFTRSLATSTCPFQLARMSGVSPLPSRQLTVMLKTLSQRAEAKAKIRCTCAIFEVSSRSWCSPPLMHKDVPPLRRRLPWPPSPLLAASARRQQQTIVSFIRSCSSACSAHAIRGSFLCAHGQEHKLQGALAVLLKLQKISTHR